MNRLGKDRRPPKAVKRGAYRAGERVVDLKEILTLNKGIKLPIKTGRINKRANAGVDRSGKY